MESLKLERSQAKKIFKSSPKWFQEVLINTFGIECFSGKIIDLVKTFDDACKEAGVDPEEVTNESDTPDEAAFQKLKLIIKVINEGWIPDWNDTNQPKWYPFFALSSGFGFSYSNYYYTITHTGVGSRLCFENEEKSNYVANQFIDLYKVFLT